ncbi:hypothetical protein FACS1894216_06190 [Synergistales bacterium]|nr:hypothetical protein FACS1894216_06190 [Synergistales bacterium]
MEREGFMVFRAAEAAPAMEGARVAFLMSPHIGMIELVEREGGNNTNAPPLFPLPLNLIT